MNIAEILKDCPKRTKLYSLVHGECELSHVDCDYSVKYPIIIEVGDGVYSFTKDGLIYAEYINAECVLFPSKENRDWSTFKVFKKEYQFKPFDKVLVRDSDDEPWDIDLFSCIRHDDYCKYICLSDIWKQCIPYEGNGHLLNTTNNPE